MTGYAFWGAIEIGLIYGLVALGVLVSFRILRFPDLTVDGSFPLGAAVAATLIVAGWEPFSATLAATLAGAAAGAVTGWLNVRLRIMDLLASILMMIALYSINLRVMGRPNVPLITEPTIFSYFAFESVPDYILKPVLMLVLVVVIKLGLDWYLGTRTGLALRATGSNPRMAGAQGVATGVMVLVGLALSNALCALAGALFAQSQGMADISMGIGTIVIGLAAVIVGESLFSSRKLIIMTAAAVLGAVLYRLFVALALNADFIGLQAQDLNLITAVLVTIFLVVPLLRQKLRDRRA